MTVDVLSPLVKLHCDRCETQWRGRALSVCWHCGLNDKTIKTEAYYQRLAVNARRRLSREAA